MTRQLRRQVLLALAIGTLLLALSGSIVYPQQSNPFSSEQQFQQGQIAYEQQNYSEAVVKLDEAIQGFAAQDNVLKHAIALGNLSLTHQALGQLPLAEDAIEASLELLGVDRDRFADISIANLSDQQLSILAPLLDIDGQLLLKQGQFDTALTRWQSAAQIYQRLKDNEGLIRNQTRQLQTLHSLGLYGQAGAIAKELDKHLSELSEPLLQVRSRRSLGDTYRSIGKLEKSEDILDQALIDLNGQEPGPMKRYEQDAIRISLGDTQLAIAIRERERQTNLSRQNLLPWQCEPVTAEQLQSPSLEDQRLYDTMVALYEEAEKTYASLLNQAQSQHQKLEARLSLLDVLLTLGNTEAAARQWSTASDILSGDAFPNRFGVYARIKLAKQGVCLKQQSPNILLDQPVVVQQLENALAIALDIENDKIATSQSYGNLGSFYEYLYRFGWSDVGSTKTGVKQTSNAHWYAKSLEMTRKALIVAQPYEFPDIAYQWQWQLGRLHRYAGQPERAISDYRQAVATLNSVRNNLLTIDSEVQFSFRDNVEPVYRELADLLLKDEEPEDKILREVIGLIDNIQLSELESFLQCNLAGTVQLTDAELPSTSAIIYTILLDNRLEIIYQIEQPDNEDSILLHHRVREPQDILNVTLANLRNALESGDSNSKESVRVYSWLLDEEIDTLRSQKIDTLVFILDGPLRNIPIAALQKQNDQYLVDEFAISLTPRLQLETPKPMSSLRPSTLFFGLSQVPEWESSFNDLPAVKDEADYVKENLPGNSPILNNEFTQQKLETELKSNPVSIIHFATHGEFSSDPEKTFILSWDDRVTSDELNEILSETPFDSKIELLVLSACQTATGDNRATLGIAGLALQAGAQSALASLWPVDDQATAQFIEYFYDALATEGTSRAQAVQHAQQRLKSDYPSPAYWAPYILVGNWL